MQQGVQTDATCNIQLCWELLVNNVASVCTQPYVIKHYCKFPSFTIVRKPKLLSFFCQWGRFFSAFAPLFRCEAPCKRTQHCWPTTPNILGCYMLLDVVACCCAKFETGQTFQPTTPNISLVLWSPKRSATMLDPFAQLFQHCWGHARSLRMVYKD